MDREQESANGSELAQRIWGRYGESPGLISMADNRALIGRITRLSTARLPLLDDVQRRWMPAHVTYRDTGSALLHAWTPGEIRPPSATDSSLPVAEPGKGGLGGAKSPLVSARIQARPARAVDVTVQSPFLKSPPPSREREQLLGDAPHAGRPALISGRTAVKEPRTPAAGNIRQDATTVGPNKSNLQPAIVQRRLHSPIQETLYNPMAAPEGSDLPALRSMAAQRRSEPVSTALATSQAPGVVQGKPAKSDSQAAFSRSSVREPSAEPQLASPTKYILQASIREDSSSPAVPSTETTPTVSPARPPGKRLTHRGDVLGQAGTLGTTMMRRHLNTPLGPSIAEGASEMPGITHGKSPLVSARIQTRPAHAVDDVTVQSPFLKSPPPSRERKRLPIDASHAGRPVPMSIRAAVAEPRTPATGNIRQDATPVGPNRSNLQPAIVQRRLHSPIQETLYNPMAVPEGSDRPALRSMVAQRRSEPVSTALATSQAPGVVQGKPAKSDSQAAFSRSSVREPSTEPQLASPTEYTLQASIREDSSPPAVPSTETTPTVSPASLPGKRITRSGDGPGQAGTLGTTMMRRHLNTPLRQPIRQSAAETIGTGLAALPTPVMPEPTLPGEEARLKGTIWASLPVSAGPSVGALEGRATQLTSALLSPMESGVGKKDMHEAPAIQAGLDHRSGPQFRSARHTAVPDGAHGAPYRNDTAGLAGTMIDAIQASAPAAGPQDTSLILSTPFGLQTARDINQEMTPATSGVNASAPPTGMERTGMEQRATAPIISSASQQAETEVLVDQVLRKLMRRLAIEGERRGWQPWR